MNNLNEQSHLTVKFFTKSKKFAISDSPYSIPSNSNPDSLSILIKGILKQELNEDVVAEDEEISSIEFDFLINNTFLESELGEFVKTNENIKTESLIEIEYKERHPAPEAFNSIVTDDWVSSIQGCDEYIILGSYNNTVQIWTTSGECIVNLPGHNGAVKSVAWISNDANTNADLKFMSASHDQSIISWSWNKKAKKVNNVEKFIGHNESIECIDIYSDKTKFISGSWDKTLKLWSLTDDFNEESTSKKNKSDITLTTKTPVFTLSGHTENVSSCKWMSANTVCTGSWDHSIKLWDTFIGQETRTLKSVSKIFLSIDYSPLNQLIAGGLSDSHVRIYDTRSNEGNIVKITLSSHTGWCSAVSWSPTDSNCLVSGSYDTCTKLWDIRNPKTAVYDLIGHEDKILCTDWSISNIILSGSSDNTFKMYKT